MVTARFDSVDILGDWGVSVAHCNGVFFSLLEAFSGSAPRESRIRIMSYRWASAANLKRVPPPADVSMSRSNPGVFIVERNVPILIFCRPEYRSVGGFFPPGTVWKKTASVTGGSPVDSRMLSRPQSNLAQNRSGSHDMIQAHDLSLCSLGIPTSPPSVFSPTDS